MQDGKNILNAFDLDAVKIRTNELWMLEKSGCYANFPAVAEYCRHALAQNGFENIEILPHRADGAASAFDCTMPPAWDITGRSFLQIAGENTILADTGVIPYAAAPWSAPTPASGATGKLIALAPGETADVNGKWVLLTISDGSNPPGGYLQYLHRNGALGVAVMETRSGSDYPDAVRWFNGTGSYGWYPVAGEPRLPVFALSGAVGKMLLRRLAAGAVTLHGVMKTRIYPGEIFTITGIIPGKSATEYALFSHIYEPFAADNSLGFGAVCGIGKALRDSGLTPRKTLRAVFSMELYGFAAFLADKKRSVKIAGALNMDAVNHRKQRLLAFMDSPLSAPWFGDWVLPEVLGTIDGTEFIRCPGTLADDTFAGDPLCGGIPVNWCKNPTGTAHHCGCDDFEPDWQWAEVELPAFAHAVVKMLQFSPQDAAGLPALAVAEFRQQSSKITARNISGTEKSLLLENLYRYLDGRLISAEKYTGTTLDKNELAKAYHSCCEVVSGSADFAATALQKEAASLIPVRLKPTPFSLADIPPAERKSFRVSRLLYALFDGSRSLLEALSLTGWLTGSKYDDAAIKNELETLNYLARYGYITLTVRNAE